MRGTNSNAFSFSEPVAHPRTDTVTTTKSIAIAYAEPDAFSDAKPNSVANSSSFRR